MAEFENYCFNANNMHPIDVRNLNKFLRSGFTVVYSYIDENGACKLVLKK